MHSGGDLRAHQHPKYGRDADQRGAGDIDIAVVAVGGGPEDRGECQRPERGGSGPVFLPEQPEDEQRDDDRASADAEQTAENAPGDADRGELRRAVVGDSLWDGGCHPGHTRRVSERAESEARGVAGTPLERTAVLLDVDGTLAPIVRESTDASVPIEVRRTLIELARRCALVACVSGRTAEDAKRVVGVGAITYIGGHGSELLAPGMSEAEGDPQMDLWYDPVNELAIEAMRELSPLGVRREEKGPIAALHWRGAADEGAAEAGLRRIAGAAESRGLAIHWGRKVLEIRPPVPFDKGRAIEKLVSELGDDGRVIDLAIYVGDDLTDLDAFAALERMQEAGTIGLGHRVAVTSAESPADLVESADSTVSGPEGTADLLTEILESGSDRP